MQENYFDPQDIEKNKGLGILISLFYFLFFLPLVMSDRKDSEYLRFRANTSLVLWIAAMVCAGISKIPFVGFVGSIASIAVGILGLVNLVYAIQGNGKKLPVIGDIKII